MFDGRWRTDGWWIPQQLRTAYRNGGTISIHLHCNHRPNNHAIPNAFYSYSPTCIITVCCVDIVRVRVALGW